MRRPLIDRTTYTITTHIGCGEYAWMKRPGDALAGLGRDCADHYAWHGDHPIPDALQSAFSAWVLEIERAPLIYNYCYRELDWEDIHSRGVEYARQLKRALGDSITIIYLKPDEDPEKTIDERREVLGDGSLLPLPTLKEIYYSLGFKDMVSRIVSGGQTGVDRAALDWAIANQVPHGGWCPKGRLALDGALDEKYQLEETESTGYRQRTRRNVHHSDGTLIVNIGELSGGTLTTKGFAEKSKKPVMVVQLEDGVTTSVIRSVLHWLRLVPIETLNIAGPSENKCPGIYALTYEILERLAHWNDEAFTTAYQKQN